MLSLCRKLNQICGEFLWLVVALAILARVLAPGLGIGLPEREGYVAICSGSEVIYIPLSQVGDGAVPEPSGDDGGHVVERVPCVWLGQYVALLPLLAILLGIAVRPSPPVRVWSDQSSHQRTARPFQARGPPLALA